MGQPTPTELASASSSATSLKSSSISQDGPNSTPTPNFVGNHSHSEHPASSGKHQKRAGMDDYLWMSSILRVIDEGVNRQDQKDDDGLAKVVTSTSKNAEGEIKVDDKTSTGVTAGKGKRRRRRRSHP
ncbi:hypothetical protein L486_05781 [Kwoniella mangroviensis CBS 10435]|uniref:Uncharacterized protein n=1 Tax=Kwoniella mangroviensis CBS 10435 TaxID=1331196 RepID=A0A1B9IMX7_9TREE|nr:hypothetical protein L486_05781 [Kwoniella mangroviensis CBS 10435]